MLLFGLSPVTLWWGDYMWLSTPIHTFFLVLAFYCMLDGRLRWAAFWIAIATMVKQTAGLLLPVVLMLELSRDWKRVPISLGIMGAVGITLSMPYLVLYPMEYLSAVASGMGGYWMEALPLPTYPVPVSVLAWYLPPGVRDILIAAVYYGIPFIVSVTALWVITWLIDDQDSQQYRQQLLVLTILLSLAMHTFFPRGIYKYYLIAFLPFLVLLIPALSGPLFQLQSRGKVRAALQKSSWLNRVVNCGAIWAVFLVSLVNVALFFVHRLVSPAILLSLFLFFLIGAWYQYDWKPRSRSSKERQ
jgi:hypothetical protein